MAPPRRPAKDTDVRLVKDEIAATLQEIKDAGLYKNERELTSPQSAHVTTLKAEALNFCANNYLGLANDPAVVAASKKALDEWGFGMAVGALHLRHPDAAHLPRARDQRVPRHRGDDPLLVVLRRERRRLRGALRRRGRDHQRRAQPRLDHRRGAAVQGDALPLQERRHDRPAGPARGRRAAGAKRKVVVTDGVFSMDGSSPRWTRSATWPTSSARSSSSTTRTRSGFVGDGGRGTPELFGVMDRVDILTGTLGKALGGASGGYVAAPPGDRRPAPPALAPLPVLQRGRPGGRRGLAGRPRARRELGRDARAAARQHGAVPLADDRGRLRPAPRHPPDPPVMFPGEDGAGRPRRSPTTCSTTASTSSPSASPSCRAARRGSGCSCRPRTPRPTCAPASTPSWRPGTPSDRSCLPAPRSRSARQGLPGRSGSGSCGVRRRAASAFAGQPVGRSRSQGRVRSKRRPPRSRPPSMATTMDFGVSTHGRTGSRSTT